MSTHVEPIGSESRPRHIRYFEILQICIIGILLIPQLASAGQNLFVKLTGLGMIAVLLGLTLAVTRARQNWARWILLIIFIYVVAGSVPFVLLMPGVPLIVGFVAILLEAALLGAVLSLLFTKQSSAWIHRR